ncbi:MAG TPA: hypothetical protein VEC99_12955 [Clostridia bacterium]|nr:hypothetical protein [Clostridia bacterium]
MVSIYCFTAPLAVVYGFHARRKAPQRVLALVGLILSLAVFVPFVMLMVQAMLNLGNVLCH